MSPESGAASTACIGLLVVETSLFFGFKSARLYLVVYTTATEHPFGKVKEGDHAAGYSYTSSPFKERQGLDLFDPTPGTNGCTIKVTYCIGSTCGFPPLGTL